MIEANDAVEKVLENIEPLGLERISIYEAIGRVIGGACVSRRDLPPFNVSAMDGYAIKASDTLSGKAKLKVKGVIPAGSDISGLTMKKGECYRIMTGAFVPEDADSVIQHELTDNGTDEVNIMQAVKEGFCIRYKGEDLKKGDNIDRTGEIFTPYHLGRFVSAGVFYISVYRKPRIAIISTGNEVTDPYNQDAPDKIFDSNSPMGKALFESAGAEVSYIGVVPDDKDALADTFKNLKNFDMIVTSAGISAGDFDYMNLMADELGIKWRFDKINQKPGKRMSFGTIGGTPLFACPGNPVSAMFCYYFYVKPAIRKMTGMKDYRNKAVKVLLGEKVVKKKDRVQFDRVRIDCIDGVLKAYPFAVQDSHIIESLVSANAYARFDNDMVGTLEEGTELEAYIFNAEQVFG